MMHEEVEVTEADRERARELAREYEDYLSAVAAMGTRSDPSEVIAEFVAQQRHEQERLLGELKIALHGLEKVNPSPEGFGSMEAFDRYVDDLNMRVARLRHILRPQPPTAENTETLEAPIPGSDPYMDRTKLIDEIENTITEGDGFWHRNTTREAVREAVHILRDAPETAIRDGLIRAMSAMRGECGQ